MPRNTAVFGPTFAGAGVVRSADITKSSLYGRSAPHYGMPKGHLPVRSYLAVPVVSHAGEVLGGLFFGHPEVGVFSPSHEETMVAIAAHAAVAIDNASLFKDAQREIERRRDAEVALRESEARLRDLLATLDLGTLLARDIDGVIRFWSEGCERLFGWTAAEAVGRNTHALLCSEFPVPQAEVKAALERDGEWVGDLRQRTRDGREVVVAVHKMLRRDADGQPAAVLECLTDVTAQRRTETALRASEARLQEVQADLLHVSRISAAGQMASALAHELNQPLTAATTAVRAARRMLADPPGDTAALAEIREAMDLAAEQTLRAGQIIRRLRDFVAREGEADKQLEDVAKLAEDAAALALVGAQERGIRVDFRFDAPLPPVIVDRIQIQQVLLNLVRNALDAMTQEDDDRVPHSRELSLTATLAEPDMVEVAVADTGPGIAPELTGRLFSAFASTKPGGMGIGLSICRSIIKAHGGRLWAEPRDRGTVFRFTLPTAAPDAAFK
jgi:two-component system sensor kinase FixL